MTTVDGVRAESATTLVRWVLLCAVALGVLGMHHLAEPASGHHSTGGHTVVAVEGGPPAAGAGQVGPVAEPGCCGDMADPASPAPSHGGGHDLRAHLCLAILAAAIGLGLLLILLGRPGTDTLRLRGRWGGTGGFSRSPPRPTSTRLAMLCVLRE